MAPSVGAWRHAPPDARICWAFNGANRQGRVKSPCRVGNPRIRDGSEDRTTSNIGTRLTSGDPATIRSLLPPTRIGPEGAWDYSRCPQPSAALARQRMLINDLPMRCRLTEQTDLEVVRTARAVLGPEFLSEQSRRAMVQGRSLEENYALGGRVSASSERRICRPAPQCAFDYAFAAASLECRQTIPSEKPRTTICTLDVSARMANLDHTGIADCATPLAFASNPSSD